MEIRDFGKTKDGRKASLYILRNTKGMAAAVTDFGATLVKLFVPGKDGEVRDVVLGYEDVSGYETGHGSIGVTVGRFANRIGGARFELNGKTYELTANNGPNALHGGRDFYRLRLWEARIPFSKVKSSEIAARAGAAESLGDWWRETPVSGLERDFSKDLIGIEGESITFCLDSPDGDQGFPGDLHIEVKYTLTDNNELHIDYYAALKGDYEGSFATPLNLTNHSYFNLNGHDSGTVYDQVVWIDADQFTPNDKWSLPTGELRDVADTPMDFRRPKRIGQDINKADEQLEIGSGYDHNFVLKGWNDCTDDAEGLCAYRKCASLYSSESGITMSVLTDLPGMQLYTGNSLNGEHGKNGAVYTARDGVCFETQFWPDAVNKKNFPGGILKSGEEFRSRTTYRFSKQ